METEPDIKARLIICDQEWIFYKHHNAYKWIEKDFAITTNLIPLEMIYRTGLKEKFVEYSLLQANSTMPND